MRVICIDDKIEWAGKGPRPENSSPHKGDIDTVIDEGYDSDLGEFYIFERFPRHIAFSKVHFVPISDITIEQLIGERELQEA